MGKRIKKLAALLGCVGILAFAGMQTAQADEGKSLDVLFVHDTHSHLESFQTMVDGNTQTVGGFAKLKTLINNQTDKNPNTLILDAGDFSMGTLIQTVYESQAAELRMLGHLGVDVSTLGNHEYDYRTKGLANMLYSAIESGDEVPALVVSNIDWAAMEEAGLTEEQQMLKEAFDAYGLKEYTIVEKGDLKIAVLGVFGVDAWDCAPTAALLFEDASEAAKRVVAEIEEKEDADMIVCVSHAGTWDEEEKSEDEILAKNVPEIDLIISGHTHSTITEPIQHGDTYIVSCGEYAKKLGSLTMNQVAEGVWELETYELIPVVESIEENPETKVLVDGFLESINSDYLSQYGFTRDQVLATNDIKFSTVKQLSGVHTEHNLGNILSDAYIYALGDEVDVAVVPAGMVRDTFIEGDITVEQVFNVFSLGIGEDGIPGCPLVKTYLTGEELKILAEIDGSISNLVSYARLYTSGLNFTYNPNRLILNKVTDCYLEKNGERIEIEDDKLYCVVADLSSAQMLGGVTDMSYGLLKLIPKFEDGTPVENYEDLIVTKDGQEVKAWVTIANYIDSFEDTDGDGISNVPDEYAEETGRKVVDDSKNLLKLINHPNKYAMLILGIGSIAVVVVVVVICVVKETIKKVWKRKTKA